jgi:hypothetical protein
LILTGVWLASNDRSLRLFGSRKRH